MSTSEYQVVDSTIQLYIIYERQQNLLMSLESFPHGNSAEYDPEKSDPNLSTTAETPESKGGSAAEREQFGWNDVIVPDDDVEAAEVVIKRMGFECKSKELSQKQYLDKEKKAWTQGEILLSINEKGGKPVGREVLRQIIDAMRENKKRVVVRVARLAPGERFG